MKKIFLALTLVASQLTIHADENSPSAHTLRENGKKVLAQLMAQRPAEQDSHVTLPWINGKKLEVNSTQLGNAALILSGAYAQIIALRNPVMDPKCWNSAGHNAHNRLHNNAVLPLQRLALVPLVIGAYRYLTGEQRNPFRIVDAQEVK